MGAVRKPPPPPRTWILSTTQAQHSTSTAPAQHSTSTSTAAASRGPSAAARAPSSHGSPLWPSLATADPAKVTKYNFLVSCASANERSIQIKGDAKKGKRPGGSCSPTRRRSGRFEVFWGGFRGISGAGRAVRSKVNGVWDPRSARAPPARPLRVAGAFGN